MNRVSTRIPTWKGNTICAKSETEDITYNYNITVLPGNLEEEKIVLKPENVTTPPTASDIIYGDSLDDSEITGGVVKDDDDREVKGTWTWKKVDGKEPEDVNPQVKDEGSEEQYIAIFTPDPDYADDYTGFEFPVTLKVKPKEVELEWSDDLFVYDGDPHKPKAVVSKGIFGSDTVNAIVGDSYAKTEVGDDYEATAKLDNKNYTIKQGQEKHKFRITPKSIKDPTIDITITYSPTDDDVLIIEIIDNGKKNDGKLIENTDYMLDIKSDPNDEFSNVTITGIGNYGKEYKTTVKNQKWTGSVLSVITVDEEARELNPHMTKVSEDSAIAMFINEIDNNKKATDAQKNEAKSIVNEIQNSPTHESDYGSYRAVVTLEMQKMDEAQVEAVDVTGVKNYIGTNGIPKSAKIGQYLNLSLWIQYIVERKSPPATHLLVGAFPAATAAA